MNKFALLILITSLSFAFLGAQSSAAPTEPAAQAPQQSAITDSLMRVMGKLVQQEYDFMDTDTLAEVAKALRIEDLAKWKGYLGLESQNPTLDTKTLRSLGITPYRAFLGKQYCAYDFTEQSTVAEIAAGQSVPIKKLRQMLQIPTLDRSRDTASLQALNVPVAKVDSLIGSFITHTVPYGISITLVGMLIVFMALLITSIVISQLVHLNRKPKAKASQLVISHSGKLVSASKDVSNNTIAAAITALFLYKHGIEERRRLLLTFHRTPTNQWRASGVMDMPNRTILRNRRQA